MAFAIAPYLDDLNLLDFVIGITRGALSHRLVHHRLGPAAGTSIYTGIMIRYETDCSLAYPSRLNLLRISTNCSTKRFMFSS